MNDIIIVPTFDRPEYLWLTLEYLYASSGALSKDLWICEDIHADKPKSFTIEMEYLALFRHWEKYFTFFRYIGRTPHSTYGNSYNVLSAIEEAAATETKRVYLIEDDVLVTSDFFIWNDYAHWAFQPWASCAGRLNRSLNFAMNGPEAIDESIKDPELCHKSVTAYNSWATCFSRTALDYFKTMPSAVYNAFAPGREQDIMIQDKIRREKLVTIWPYVPRAYHMGWYSYHREGMKFYGTLEEKVKGLRRAVTDPVKIRAMASIQQIDAFPKEQHEWAHDLRLR